MNHQQIYNQIIERGNNRVLTGYSEKHHIIPKCLGGTDDDENLVVLTAREHFICHKLLTEIYPNERGLHYASWMMATTNNHYMGRNYRIGSREYERLRESLGGYSLSEETKLKIGMASRGRIPWNKDMTGILTVSDETRVKMSEAQSGEKHHRYNTHLSDEHKQKISNTLLGVGKSKETRKRMSESKRGIVTSSKKINQYTKNGIFIKEWDSLSDASRLLEIQITNISFCALGKRKSAGGYKWKLK